MNKTLNKRIIIVAVIICITAAFFIFGLSRYLTLSYLKQSKEQLSAFYTESPALVITAYILIYILTTSLSLPGATVLTLAGGAISPDANRCPFPAGCAGGLHPLIACDPE